MSGEQKIRQRGKKKKKSQQQQQQQQPEHREEIPAATFQAANVNPNFNSNFESDFAGPSTSANSWSRPATSHELSGDPPFVPSAPFGLVDPDLKNYLREAFTQLKSLSQQSYNQDQDDRFHFDHNGGDDEQDENEGESSQHDLLMKATLKELDGKELQVATDNEGSLLLEYLANRLDGKSLRILADRLAGNYSTIASHRFGSHVFQALLSSFQKLISSETKIQLRLRTESGQTNETIKDEHGVLRSATTLVLDMCSETSEDLSSLFKDQFGTHVVRSLLLLLSSRPIISSSLRSGDPNSTNASLRSKRSTKFREGQIDQTSNSESAANASSLDIHKGIDRRVPAAFKDALKKVSADCLRDVGINEIRALAVDPISSPTLQLLLRLENESFSELKAEDRGSLTEQLNLSDLILGGLIASQQESEEVGERLDHLETLLRDPVGTHVLETLLKSVPKSIHSRFWRIYLKGRVVKLGTHPVGNFVVRAGVERLGSSPSHLIFETSGKEGEVEDQDLLGAIEEIKSAGDKLVKEGKVGILQALVKRCGHLSKYEKELIDAIRAAFRMDKDDDEEITNGKGKQKEKDEDEDVAVESQKVDLLVPVILSLRTKKAYIRTRGKQGAEKKNKKRKFDKKSKEEKQAGTGNEDVGEEAGAEDQEENDGIDEKAQEMEATVQGSVLLQLMARLSSPHNDSIYHSLLSLPSLLPLCTSSIGSHVLHTSLSSTSSTFQQRRLLLSALIPHILLISKDKYGSRVCDSIWENSDPFTKSKIVRELLGKERELVQDWYGRFFARKLNFGLFRKDEESWKREMKSMKRSGEVVKSLREEAEEEITSKRELETVQEANIGNHQSNGEQSEEMNGNSVDAETGGKRKRDDKAIERKKKKRAKKGKSKEDSELDQILGGL